MSAIRKIRIAMNKTLTLKAATFEEAIQTFQHLEGLRVQYLVMRDENGWMIEVGDSLAVNQLPTPVSNLVSHSRRKRVGGIKQAIDALAKSGQPFTYTTVRQANTGWLDKSVAAGLQRAVENGQIVRVGTLRYIGAKFVGTKEALRKVATAY